MMAKKKGETLDDKTREARLEALSYPEAPKLVTEIPGPKAGEIFQKMLQYETPQRPAGSVIPLCADEAKGATIKDVDGNVLIDFVAGVGVKSTGSCHPKVVEAIKKQAEKMAHHIDSLSPLKVELVEKMRSTAPHGLKDNCFLSFFQSGTTAAEAGVKQCRMIQQPKNQVVVFEGAYHGVFGTTNAMTTGEFTERDMIPSCPMSITCPTLTVTGVRSTWSIGSATWSVPSISITSSIPLTRGLTTWRP